MIQESTEQVLNNNASSFKNKDRKSKHNDRKSFSNNKAKQSVYKMSVTERDEETSEGDGGKRNSAMSDAMSEGRDENQGEKGRQNKIN
jgi:hypothetical protein